MKGGLQTVVCLLYPSTLPKRGRYDEPCPFVRHPRTSNIRIFHYIEKHSRFRTHNQGFICICERKENHYRGPKI